MQLIDVCWLLFHLIYVQFMRWTPRLIEMALLVYWYMRVFNAHDIKIKKI